LRSKFGERILRLEEFLKGKRLIDLKANEILIETIFQELDEDSACAFEKTGMRNSLIIALVSSAVYLKLDKSTRVVKDVRIAFNRVTSKIPERARLGEKTMQGKILNAELVKETTSVLGNELRLSSDFRATSEYRHDVDRVLFKRALDRCFARLVGQELV
jgi:CO/xanthine dehydrogenase FAD-binding subunit